MTHRSRPPELRDLVSDHALVRYLERVRGFDFDPIRAEILSDGRRVAVQAMGQGRLPIGSDGLDLVVASGRVVTVAPRIKRSLRRSAQRKFKPPKAV